MFAKSQKNYSILLIGNGYIGSYLSKRLSEEQIEHDIVSRSYIQNNTVYTGRLYQSLEATELAKYTHIFWFAGHSSVPQSINDPIGATQNNVIDLFNLILKIPKSCHFIYASSASVYSGLSAKKLATIYDGTLNVHNQYDASKKSFDLLLSQLDLKTTGLRMGTVSGFSPRLREELIFNAMSLSAMKNKKVQISNGSNFRSILFLNDLFDVLLNFLKSEPGEHIPKFLNCGSMNASIAEIGKLIAGYFGAEVLVLNNTNTYSFQMDLYNPRPKSNRDIIYEQCAKFAEEYK